MDFIHSFIFRNCFILVSDPDPVPGILGMRQKYMELASDPGHHAHMLTHILIYTYEQFTIANLPISNMPTFWTVGGTWRTQMNPMGTQGNMKNFTQTVNPT